ncbi:hypothetical protein [Fodinicola feengrottensis]|uniref:hypothetical protein n=1 Tax=Fodinicola feengrottensis TaxID=435914 RepID=UPI002442EAFC|nr:hypothetical protein [Fodinicola feengrottensis]
MVEQNVGLRGLEAVHLLDDRVVANRGGSVEHRGIVRTNAVVVMVETVDIAEPQVDGVFFLVPVVGDRLLVRGTHHSLVNGRH